MIGRNDVCPCGSGKKYKKCCLNKDVVMERAERKVVLSQKQYSELYKKMYEFSTQEKYNDEREKAKEMFYIVDDSSVNYKFEKFFNTYFIQDHIMESKKVMTVEYYESNRERLTQHEFDILRTLFESYVSVYKVEEVLDDKMMLVDELTGNKVYTDDINLLKDFKAGDFMIARIVDVKGTNILIDVTISISESVKDVIVNDIEFLFGQYKDIYQDVKTFLIHHTHILYKYMQQLLDPSISEYLKKQKDEAQSKKAKVQETDCKVCDILKQNSTEESTDKCIEFWNEYKDANGEVKGSENGWAAAVEYHIMKTMGVNVTQVQIAKKYEISTSTLGKRYKDLKVS